jgi:hypothetical protein
MTPLSEFGTDPVTVANVIKARIEELQTQLKTAGKADVEQIKAQLKTAYDAEKSKDTKRIEVLTGSMYRHVVVSQATQAIAAQKGDSNLLMPFVQQQIKVAEGDDGEIVAQVVDKAGNLRYSPITPGQVMTIAELVAEMKASTTYAKLFESTTPSGSGKRPASGGMPQSGVTKSAVGKIASGLKSRG